MKLKLFALILFLSAIQMDLYAQDTKYNLLIGTYTNTNKSEGIYVYEFDSKTGDLVYKNKVTDIKNPSYLAASNDAKYVYAVSEGGQARTGNLFAYRFNSKTGQLQFINKSGSGGNGPCYVSVDSKNRFIFAANYASGSLGTVAIEPDGALSEHVQSIQHTGKSVDKARQQAPHTHSVVLSPDEKYLFAADLGVDKIYHYKINYTNKTNPLTVAKPAFTSVDPGNGPRHFTFHPNHKFAYLIQEMGGKVNGYKYKKGKLKWIETTNLAAENFKGEARSADIHISPDGKFLYASNRGDANDLVIYSINKHTGRLTLAGRQSSLGKTPRNFAIDPTGNFLLVANQDTDDIFVFKRDKVTGLLTSTGKRLEIGRPVCLKFVAVD